MLDENNEYNKNIFWSKLGIPFHNATLVINLFSDNQYHIYKIKKYIRLTIRLTL